MGTRHLSPFRGLLVGLVGELVTLDVLVRRDLVNRNTDSSEPKFVGFGYGHMEELLRGVGGPVMALTAAWLSEKMTTSVRSICCAICRVICVPRSSAVKTVASDLRPRNIVWSVSAHAE